MRVWQQAGHEGLNEMRGATAFEAQGFAGWLLGLVRGWQGARSAQKKRLTLVETLPLGGKRQLMLVTCGGESFLVGGGPESVETIVRLNREVSPGLTAENMDGSCS
jgi:flagellar biogenesis protein FliO